MNEYQNIPLRVLKAIDKLADIGEYVYHEDILSYIGDLQEQVECVVEDLEDSEKERDEQNGYIQDLEADLYDAELKISELKEYIND